jgi:hypothetical protein
MASAGVGGTYHPCCRHCKEIRTVRCPDKHHSACERCHGTSSNPLACAGCHGLQIQLAEYRHIAGVQECQIDVLSKMLEAAGLNPRLISNTLRLIEEQIDA